MKEGGLFNVQPMSKWDTILKKGRGGVEVAVAAWWGFWRMKGGSAGENFGCPWRGDRKRGFEDTYFNINLPPSPHTHTLPPFQPLGNLGQSRYH